MLWGLSQSWNSGPDTAMWWVNQTSANVGFVLPFLSFAVGIGMAREFARSRHLIRFAVTIGFALGALSYLTVDWVAPAASFRERIVSGSATPESIRFGPGTPPGLLRTLRFVEANPPTEFSMSVDTPSRHPPSILRWQLHQPVVMVVFGILNLLLGVLAARVTADLRRHSRRNARLAIGMLGGIAFFACVMIASPIRPFLQDGTLRSGIVSAWVPLALPLTEALLLGHLIRRRRG